MFKNQDKIIFDNKIEISPVIKTQIPSQTKKIKITSKTI